MMLSELNSGENPLHQGLKLRGRKKRGSATPQMDLSNLRPPIQMGEVEIELFQNRMYIRRGNPVVSSNPRIAAAVGTKALAERNVNIDGRADSPRLAFKKRLPH
jgi:hypothetical protein